MEEFYFIWSEVMQKKPNLINEMKTKKSRLFHQVILSAFFKAIVVLKVVIRIKLMVLSIK